MDISEDEELLNEIYEQQFMLFTSIFTAASNTQAFFEDEEWQTEQRILVNPNEGVRDQLSYIRNLPHLFKLMTHFSCDEFEELCGMVCPIIATTAR